MKKIQRSTQVEKSPEESVEESFPEITKEEQEEPPASTFMIGRSLSLSRIPGERKETSISPKIKSLKSKTLKAKKTNSP